MPAYYRAWSKPYKNLRSLNRERYIDVAGSMSAKSGNVIGLALANHGVCDRVVVRWTGLLPMQRSVAAAAAKNHHLTHDAQSNLRGIGCPQIETSGRPHGGDFFFCNSALAKILEH